MQGLCECSIIARLKIQYIKEWLQTAHARARGLRRLACVISFFFFLNVYATCGGVPCTACCVQHCTCPKLLLSMTDVVAVVACCFEHGQSLLPVKDDGIDIVFRY